MTKSLEVDTGTRWFELQEIESRTTSNWRLCCHIRGPGCSIFSSYLCGNNKILSPGNSISFAAVVVGPPRPPDAGRTRKDMTGILVNFVELSGLERL